MTTKLLEKAIAEAKKAPPEMQDAIANLILAEIEDEDAWQKAFDNTTDTQWDRLANTIRDEIRSDETESLDAFLK